MTASPSTSASPPDNDRLAGRSEVLVREYQENAPAGLIGDWLDARGIPWRVSSPHDEPELPEDPPAIIALGSSASAYWSQPPWIERECQHLGAAARAGIPVLGICFGAQALARGLGATVSPAAVPEVGWVSPDSDLSELRGPYLAWHFDAITLPPGARVLARTSAALQAYSHGRAIGLQFHPEVTAGIWRDWGNHDPAALRARVPDPQQLEEEIAAAADVTRARTFRLLDWWRRSPIADR